MVMAEATNHYFKHGSYIRLYTSPVVITFVYKKTLPSRL